MVQTSGGVSSPVGCHCVVVGSIFGGGLSPFSWGWENRVAVGFKAFGCSPRVVRPGRTVWRPRRTGPSETSIGGGMCLLVLHLQWYICPLLVIRQGLNRALLASEVAPEEVRRSAKPATTQYSLPLTASASSRRKTNICVRIFLLVVI